MLAYCCNLRKKLQVLRLEVRLGSRQKIKSLFKTLGIERELTFDALYNADLSKLVLLHYWQNFTADMPIIALSGFKPEDIYAAMLAESEGATKPAKLLQRLGLLMLVDSIGMRGTKCLISEHADARTWQRIKKDVGSIDQLANLTFSAIREAEQTLHAFEPMRLEDVGMTKEDCGNWKSGL